MKNCYGIFHLVYHSNTPHPHSYPPPSPPPTSHLLSQGATGKVRFLGEEHDIVVAAVRAEGGQAPQRLPKTPQNS